MLKVFLETSVSQRRELHEMFFLSPFLILLFYHRIPIYRFFLCSVRLYHTYSC